LERPRDYEEIIQRSVARKLGFSGESP